MIIPSLIFWGGGEGIKQGTLPSILAFKRIIQDGISSSPDVSGHAVDA